MNARKYLVLAIFLLGSFYSSSQALTHVAGDSILTTEWRIALDTLSPSQAVNTKLFLVNLYPLKSFDFLIDVFLVFYTGNAVPLSYFEVDSLHSRDLASLDLYNDLHLPMNRGVVAMMSLPSGTRPDDPNAQPLYEAFDGYISQKVYDISSGSPRLTGVDKTGFLGSNGTNNFAEFKGLKPWIKLNW